MVYSTIYEYSIDFLRFVLTPLPVLLVFVLTLVFIIYGRKRIRQDYIFKYVILFFGYMFAIFSFVFLVVMLMKIPKALAFEKRTRDIIQTNSYQIVEGKISNYRYEELSGQYIHRFDLDDIHFEHINYGKIIQVGKSGRISDFSIDMNASYRITYFSDNENNVILKIEISE